MNLKNPKILVTIPLFNPGRYINRLMETIRVSGYTFLIWSNSTLDSHLISELSNLRNVIFINHNKNLGLSSFLQFSSIYAYSKNFDVLLNLDQDTLIDDNLVHRVSEFLSVSELPDDIIQLSLLGGTPNINQEFIAINSGSIFFIGNLHSFGFHSQKYFVDCVDYKFSIDVYSSKYKIFSVDFMGIDHGVNQGHKTKYGFRYKPVSFLRFRSIFFSYIRILVESFFIRELFFFRFFLKDFSKQTFNFIKNIL
jgi:rhamnosyltransferase